MIYAFDIDNTITCTLGNGYTTCKVKPEVVATINKLYDDGHTIKIFTGRGSKSGLDWHELTEKQLKEWGIKYHELIMGKPDADFFIDDKNLSLTSLNCIEAAVVDVIVQAAKTSNKVLIAGNGGSCSQAEHFAAELMGKFAYDSYMICLSLTTNASLVTAIANDMGYERIFEHQVLVMGQKGDVFIGLTTSQSKNVVKAAEAAKQKGLTTMMICGSKSQVQADYIIRMDGQDVAEIQNRTIQFLHALAYSVKKQLWEASNHA